MIVLKDREQLIRIRFDRIERGFVAVVESFSSHLTSRAEDIIRQHGDDIL